MADIPTFEISELPSLPLAERQQLPGCPAIYFAIAGNGEVLYIGRTVSLWKRWCSHQRRIQLEQLGGVRIAWLSGVDADSLSDLERTLVDRFNPPLNGAPVVYGDAAAVFLSITPTLNKWLKQEASERGFRNVQQLINHYLREAWQRDLAKQAA